MVINFLRSGFLVRPYDEQSISTILDSIGRGIKIDNTHSGNHFKKLL
jgi:hypothetical protein